MLPSLFLSFHTNSLAPSACGLGMLPSDLESPFVSDTLVASNFIKSFDVFSEFGFEDVGGDLEVLALLVVFLSVEEPSGNAVALGVVDDVGDAVALGFGQLSGSESWVDSEDFTDEESVSSSDTFDFIEGVWDGSLTVDVSIENTVNMLEVRVSVFDDE